jgi:deoxyribodipyrimidine photo-lyase
MSTAFLSALPEIRLRAANSAPVHPQGEFVCYWMTAQRRPTFNFALQRAVEWSQALGKPLLIFEALRRGYPWASPRLHRFVIQGMEDHQQHFQNYPVTYFPYVEPRHGEGKGLLESLASRACVVVSDYFPCFFLPKMVAAVAPRLPVRLELVDGNGLLPLAAAPKVYERAVDFRRFLQKSLAPHLSQTPLFNPLQGVSLAVSSEPLPEWQRWPSSLALPDFAGGVGEVEERGGFKAADQVLNRFLQHRLAHYEQRSEPSLQVSSGLSAHLHFGHISVHQILAELADQEDWSPAKMRYRPTGTKDGSWGMSSNAEGFLDELVTWRELGYNLCHHNDQYDRYESLPAWARTTLEAHQGDPRPYRYSLEQFEAAATHDRLWNAAQRQLREEGRIHNYLRMIWGKKILEWTEHPRQALEVMIELNNKYALDGRNPNSYSGIFWCLGRYDRPWFQRPIFGTVRYMSSDATARKFKLKGYLERWS